MDEVFGTYKSSRASVAIHRPCRPATCRLGSNRHQMKDFSKKLNTLGRINFRTSGSRTYNENESA